MASVGRAYGGRGDTLEVVEQQGLFLLQDFQQWAGVNYQYSGHQANGNAAGFATHRLEELYHAQTDLAILSPHFLDFQLGGDLAYDQLYNTSDASGSSFGKSLRYQYNLNVTALDRSWHPLEVFSSQTLDTVVTPFSPTLNTDVSRSGVAALFLRDPFRAKFRYETNTQTITGAGNDSTSTSDSFQATLTHTYRDINAFNCDFSLNSNKNTQIGVVQNGYGNSLDLTDTLSWGAEPGPGRPYSLVSELQRQFTSTLDLPQTLLYWNETALGRLGKALEVEADSRYTSNKTAISPGNEQDYQNEVLIGQIKQHLFQSLDTRLVGTYSDAVLPGGGQDSYAGLLGLAYRKKLPAFSTLKVDLSDEYGMTNLRGTASPLAVVNEIHSVTQPFQVIPLKVAGSLQSGSVQIQGYLIQPANPQVLPDKVFTYGVDYTVDLTTGVITWGPIAPAVSQVNVNYTVLSNPSESYSTDTLTLNTSLGLFGGRYQLDASYLSQKRNLISGSPDNSGLYNTQIVTLRGMKTTETQVSTVEYSDYLAGPSRYQYLEADWVYTPVLQEYAVQLQARNRYTMYGAEANIPAHTGNSLTLAASESTTLFGRMLCLLSANVVDERGEDVTSSDSVFLRTSLRARFNQLVITFVGSTGWRFAGATESRDDSVRLDIIRYF